MTLLTTTALRAKNTAREPVMRQRDDSLHARYARSPLTGDMRSFTGCIGHIGHFMATAARGRARSASAIRVQPGRLLEFAPMPIVHEHNLARPIPKQCQYGIRVRLRSTDPFKNLVGADWVKEHWFATREERDRALKEMSGRYVYFRPGDQPSLEFEKVDK
jgi:hypothetical protein